ncbi:MAG: fibrobacter succinogenes major paralogous domain-containing protein [Bacteroidales bacterium]|nr:fibrobacter succinogenes major paralogous domain-containing protein [Bacteroidales bacterium]MDD3701957.1 fibrobacter succinogenes major paralogous domain-containing protein [Bacteroidales bacterium]
MKAIRKKSASLVLSNKYNKQYMKRVYYSLVLFQIIIFGSSITAQEKLEISFEGHYYGQAVRLDSVLIRNITKGCDTILYSPDTILVLDYAVNLAEIHQQQEVFRLSQNYPNPVEAGRTSFEVYMPESGRLTLTASLLNGQPVAMFDQKIDHGRHLFSYYPPVKGVSVIWASDGRSNQHLKIIHVSSPLAVAEKLVYQIRLNQLPVSKSVVFSGFDYDWADTLWYVAYSLSPDRIVTSAVLEGSPDINSHMSFSMIEGLPCAGTEAVKHGGQLYSTVMIEEECWLKENLNIGIMIHSDSTMTDNGIIEKYCYDNDPENCREYGGLYQWDELMNYTYGDGSQGICPQGWHITSIEDWNDLTSKHPGYTLKERGHSHWIEGTSSTNSTGLTILPGGYKWWSDGSFEQLRKYAGFYTSTELPSPPSWGVWVKGFSWNESGSHSGNAYTTHGDSVRCIKDAK